VPKISLSLTATKAAATEDSCNPQSITAMTEPNPKTFKPFLWLNPTISPLLAFHNSTMLPAQCAPCWQVGKEQGWRRVSRVVQAQQPHGCSSAANAGAVWGTEVFPSWLLRRRKMGSCPVTYPV